MSRDCRNCIYGEFRNGGYDFPHVVCEKRKGDKRRLSTIFGDEGEFGEEFHEALYCEDFISRDTFVSKGLKEYSVDELKEELMSRNVL